VNNSDTSNCTVCRNLQRLASVKNRQSKISKLKRDNEQLTGAVVLDGHAKSMCYAKAGQLTNSVVFLKTVKTVKAKSGTI